MERLTLGSDSGAEFGFGLKHFINEAHTLALRLGPFRRLDGRATLEEAEAIMKELGDLGTLIQRDGGHSSTVAKNLAWVMSEALVKDYNIKDKGMQKILYNIAVEMYSDKYEPMRVLGNTAGK